MIRELDTRPETLRLIGATAAANAEALTSERVAVLRAAGRPWDDTTVATFWLNGVHDTLDGQTYSLPWRELGALMAEYAREIAPKASGMWITPAISANGRCRDADIEQITQLALDADGAGDWVSGLEILRAAELAFIATRSSSHSPRRPKFHVHLPLAQYWCGPKAQWRQFYRHCVAWLSVVFDLARDAVGSPPRYGFDHATDRLGQPWFFGARRSEAALPPEVIIADGGSLDLESFLRDTGFGAQYRDVSHRRATPSSKRTVANAGRTPPSSILERAFAAVGWLGPVRANGTTAVLCPWVSMHSVGTAYDGSTVLFPPTAQEGLGWFKCLHSSCVDRSQQEVMLTLPPEALRQALVTVGERA